MKISIAPLYKITITDLIDLDPVDVILEDFSHGNGRIILICAGQSWSYHWNSMGCDLREFFCTTSNDYLLEKLLSNRSDTNLSYLDRIVTAVKVALETMKAVDIARNPLPDTSPKIDVEVPSRRSPGIQADDFL